MLLMNSVKGAQFLNITFPFVLSACLSVSSTATAVTSMILAFN